MEPNGKPNAPFQQWQNFYPPYAYAPGGGDDDSKFIESITNAERNLTSGNASLAKDIHQTTLGLRDAIEKGNNMNGHAIERNSGLVQSAVERTGSAALSTSERVGGQVASAVERNGGQLMTAVEKVAGENRLTTTISSAANRQASADAARDLAISIERNGANSVNAVAAANTTLLGSIERNAGENRVTTVNAQGILDAKLTDVRHSVLADVNRTGAEMINSNTQNLNVLTKHVTDGAWETRQALSQGFSTNAVEIERVKADVMKQGSDYYSSLMLEQQKMGQYLGSKSDTQFAMSQMEMQKCKADLSAQSAQQFSIGQLEQQKLGATISAQMSEAKYDSLKNNNDLAKQISDCCCALKEKNDTLDRERLRDNLNTCNTDNNMLKVLEQARQGSGLLGGPGFGGGYGGFPGIGGGYGAGILGGPGYGAGAGAGPFGHSEGAGNVHVYSERGRGRRRSRSCSRSRSRSGGRGRG